MTRLPPLARFRTRGAAFAALCALAAPVGIPLAAHAEEYRLGVQDRLRVHVAEWPALSGEVVVGPTGDITLPIIGRVPAADLNTAQLAEAIARRLQEKTKLPQTPDTAVDVAVYRPFYILGNVQSPGEYPFRPGMRVLNALSIAGGLYRNERAMQWDIDRVTISSRGELAVLAVRRSDLKAERIRLEAELDDSQAFPPVPADADEALKRALAEQRQIFEANLERRKAERILMESSVRSGTQEIASIAKQIIDVGQKVTATQAELDQVRKLAKADLAVHRLLPLERAFADAKREQQDLEITRLRSEQRLNDTKRALANLDEQRRNAALAGIQRVNAQTREADERTESLTRLLDGAASHTEGGGDPAAPAPQAGGAPAQRFTIVRASGDQVQEIEADEATRMLPGDVLKVSSEAPRAAKGASGRPAVADLARRPEKGR